MENAYDLLLISVDSPILLGIYEGQRLVQSYERAGKFSDTLPQLFSEILRKVRKNTPAPNIYYANGPGNFSAIKLTHIFLQTLSITQNIRLFCADAFHFSDSKFINAYGKVHFYKDSARDAVADSARDSMADSAMDSMANSARDSMADSARDFMTDSAKCGAIRTTALDSKYPNSFTLPQRLDLHIFSEDCAPLYVLPAV